MKAVRILSLGLLVTVLGCQQKTAPTPETRPAVRAANGTLYDVNCLKGIKPGTMAKCAVSASAKKAWGSSDTATLNGNVNYFVWQLSYFDEMQMCQWLFGLDACYSYFGISHIPGPQCDVGWIHEFNQYPMARNCGWYWDPWYPRWNPRYPQWPTYPTQPSWSCEEIKAERDWLADNASYCSHDSQCGNAYTADQWGSCEAPPTNNWLRSPELDYWVDLYVTQCLTNQGAIFCPQTLVACPPPKCVQGRCRAGCYNQ